MGLRAIGTAMIVIAAIVLAQMFLAAPFLEVMNSLNDTGDYESDFLDGNELMEDLPGSWFNMGLIGIFGIMVWGVAWILREEITRRRI